MHTRPTILVTGASGQLGHRTVEILLTEGSANVIAASRDPGKLSSLVQLGASTRRVDFNDAASLPATFAGVDRLLIVSTDALDEPGLRLRQHLAAVQAAVTAGIKHVIYTSMPNPEPGSLIPFAPDHYETEQALAASPLPWTILRNTWYAENLLPILPQTLASGQWFTSAGQGRIAHVTREDCARAAAAALLSATTENRRLDITGPEALTTDQIAAMVSGVFDKKIDVIHVSDEQLSAGLSAAGIPAFLVPLFVAFDANTRAGRADVVSNAVETLTGRPAQSLRHFLLTQRANLAN